jgi:AcrR family transcriptional regulator
MMFRQRREANRESLRRAILDAARPLFVREGYEATSIRNIALKAGCSPGILYHYFEDKQSIMAELVSETFAKLGARMGSIRADKAPLPDRFRRALRAYIQFGLDHPHHYSLLFSKPLTVEGNEKVFEAFQTHGMATFGCLLGLSHEAIAAGLVRPEIQDEHELAQTIWVATHGLVSAQIAACHFPWIEQSRLIDRLVDVLSVGIGLH